MNKILVIGSQGFIGQHCFRYFKNNKENIVHGCDVSVDYNALNYHLIDATNSDFSSIFQSTKFNVCINCSGAASVPESIKNPARDFQLNTFNVFKILDALRKYAPNCKFINLSSAAVYGNPEKLPISETQPLVPVSPYGYHKLQSELICKMMSNQYGLKTLSLRIFSAFGEGLFKQLFWDLYKKSENKKMIKLFGTGEESRDFIHIQDILQIIDLVIQHAEFNADIFNVANGEEIFIKDAVKLFFDNLGERIKFQFIGNQRKGDPSNWVADISKISKLGYSQKINLDEGLQIYIKWLRELG